MDRLKISNCDIDFFIFCHCFQFTRLKFLKFERDQNDAKIFQIGNTESVKHE